MSRPPADFRSVHSPDALDAMVLAHGALTWEHVFQGVRFERLVDLALSAEPVVQVRLRFGLHEQHPVVSGAIQSTLQLTCQRCLHTMQQCVDETFDLMLVDSEAGAERVPEQFEPWLVNATHANVTELVEEQLLLALPLISRHADAAECQRNLATAVPAVVIEPEEAVEQVEPDAAAQSPGKATVQTPFSQLRDLMRKQ